MLNDQQVCGTEISVNLITNPNVATPTARQETLPRLETGNPESGHPVVFINSAFLAIVGMQRDAVLGRSLLEVLSDRIDSCALACLKIALADGPSDPWLMRISHTDKAALRAAAYVTRSCGKEGETVGHTLTLVDLAALEEFVSERNSIQLGICDEAPSFVALSKGEDHRFVYANAAYRKLVGRDDLSGIPFAEALPELALEGLVTVLDDVYRSGVPFRSTNMAVIVRNPENGSLEKRWVDVLNHPVRDEYGTVTGLFCEGYEVTELHRRNEAIAALTMKTIRAARVNAVGKMAAALAHELNQPLTAITGYLAGVQATGEQMPELGRITVALDGISGATQRAAAIIDHLRRLTNQRKPRRETFDLRTAIDECERLVGASCRAKVVFDNQVSSLVEMTADRVMVQQIMINLLQNSSEAMSDTERGCITINALQDDRNIIVSVADNGPGIAAEMTPHLFLWTETEKDDGMGIGLAICRTIAEWHGGDIWLEKNEPDGAEFRFRIPRTEQVSPAQPLLGDGRTFGELPDQFRETSS